MRRGLVAGLVLFALLGSELVNNSLGAADKYAALPGWLKRAERQTLDRVFGGAKPIQTWHLSYPHKIAVIFEFRHVIVCRTCSGPSAGSVPRGRVIRVSFDRKTHKLSGSMRFCESRGSLPPRALCLRR